jgi:hAT family C-terminal dimerisation region
MVTVEIASPRVAGGQQNCTNVPAASAHEYFRRAVFLPFVEICMAQLHERFLGDSAIANRSTLLLPKFCNRAAIVEVEELTRTTVQFFSSRECHSHCFETELLRLKSYWQRQDENKRPVHVMEALRITSDLGTYPTLVILFRIFATIPITTATAERSFSNLKFIKNYLRSTMTENRLNGLAHLFINRDIKLDYNKVIDQFGGEHNRRLSLPELQPVYDVNL